MPRLLDLDNPETSTLIQALKSADEGTKNAWNYYMNQSDPEHRQQAFEDYRKEAEVRDSLAIDLGYHVAAMV